MTVLVAEVGGTTMRVGRYDAGLTDRRVAATPNHLGGVVDHAGVLDALVALCAQIGCGPVDLGSGDTVALAYAGPIDPKGVLLAAPTVVGAAEPYDVLAALRARWRDCEVIVLNDLTAAGFRYVANGLRDFAIVTVGSGVGHKVFLDGQPLAGASGRGGEIGHVRVDFGPDALPCDCGGVGHIGGLASGRGVTALVARRLGRSLSAPEIVRAYAAGDPEVTSCVREGLRYLGVALAAIHVDTGVERFVIQGGFARAMGSSWLAELAGAAAEACWSIGQVWADMVQLGHPDDDSALLGAGWYARGGDR